MKFGNGEDIHGRVQRLEELVRHVLESPEDAQEALVIVNEIQEELFPPVLSPSVGDQRCFQHRDSKPSASASAQTDQNHPKHRS